MGEAVASQVLALELEKVRPNLSLMYQQDDTLWSEFKPKTDVEVVSGRPTRVPMELLAGGKFRVADPDGGDLGLGSGPTTDKGELTPVYFFQCTQYTKATEINTDQKQKAIESYAELVMKRAMEQFNTNMEAVIQGDGSNTLDTIVTGSSASAQIVVNNANQFYDNQDIDIWDALGGSKRGTVTILSVDAGNKTLYCTGNAPSGTTAGDLLLVSGSAGTAGSGIYGVKYFQVNSNTGSVMGLNRASYPGKLSTPTVNAANQAITPAMARRSLAQIQIALGIKTPDSEKLVYNMNVDQVAAWENVGLVVTSVIQNQLKGDQSEDMLKKSPPKTFAGRPIIGGSGSIHATPGRIDGLCLKHWFRVENQPIDYYEVGGQTLFPTYGASGGLSASTMFYLWTGVNIGNDNVRAGVYISSLAIPSGY
jgi:hypothetical protein